MKAFKYSYPTDSYMLIGTVVKAQGLRGEVKILPFSGQPENFSAYKTLLLVDKKGDLSPELTVTRMRIQGGLVVIQFNRVADRTHAEQLTGMGVLLAIDDLPPPEEDEFYLSQLEGLKVSTLDGRMLGRVESVFSNGAQDVMVIRQDGREYLIPLAGDIIHRQTDEELIIDPPPGLLDIYQDDGNQG